MKKPFFIIIRGSLGIGKSTISQELSNKLNAEHISIDNILKENNLDKINKKEGCISSSNFIKANEIILPNAKGLLNKGKTVIFDGNFYHKEQIEHLINNLNFKSFIFTLKAPVGVCIKRDNQRKKVYGEGAAKAVHNLVSRFDYGTNINIENKDINESIDEILKEIK